MKKQTKPAAKKLKTGVFGTIYEQFKDKPKEAILHLKKVKEGECVNAFYRKELGYISIVWGENDGKNKGYGLKHIIEKHGADIKSLGFTVEDFVAIIVQFGEISVKKAGKKKVVFEGEYFRFVIQTDWYGNSKRLLLTAFDIRKKPTK